MADHAFFLTAYRPADHARAHAPFVQYRAFATLEAALRHVDEALITTTRDNVSLGWRTETAGGRIDQMSLDVGTGDWWRMHTRQIEPVGAIVIQSARAHREHLGDRAAETATA